MKKTASKKVVVTGGAGFIGSNLVDELVLQGFKVHVIDDLSGGKRENVNKKAKLHIADVTNINEIRPIIKGASYVFHLAAIPSISYSIERPVHTDNVNVGGTRNVLVASAEAKVSRVIYSASAAAYGNLPPPHAENLSAEIISPYGLHKYVGELYCKLWNEVYALETVSLRYFNVYGPRQNPEGAYASVISKFFKMRSVGKPMTIFGDGKQTRDFTSVHDVVRANILAMKSKKVGKGEVVNVGAGKNQSVEKIAELIGGDVVYLPAQKETRDSLADNSLAKKLLGWSPKITIEAGIAELKKKSGF